MIVSIRTWFVALSGREKLLISVLVLLLAGFIGFYAIVRPFSSAVNSAELRYQEAIERKGRILAKSALFQAPAQESAGNRQAAAGPIESTVSQSAGEAGFATSAINTQSDGSVTMTIDSAKSTALFRWIAMLEQRGITVSEISVNPAANETITATLKLR